MSGSWGKGSTRAWRTLRALVLQRDHHTCRIGTPGVCVGKATHVDHIITKEQGGSDAEDNLRAACEPCNLGRKRARTVVDDAPPVRVSSW